MARPKLEATLPGGLDDVDPPFMTKVPRASGPISANTASVPTAS